MTDPYVPGLYLADIPPVTGQQVIYDGGAWTYLNGAELMGGGRVAPSNVRRAIVLDPRSDVVAEYLQAHRGHDGMTSLGCEVAKLMADQLDPPLLEPVRRNALVEVASGHVWRRGHGEPGDPDAIGAWVSDTGVHAHWGELVAARIIYPGEDG